MFALMMAALVGDLIFLPAILAGPLGRVFDRKKKRAVRSDEAPADTARGPAAHAPHRSARTPGTAERVTIRPDQAHDSKRHATR
jgi:hypothetical protein